LADVPRAEWIKTVIDNLRTKYPNGVEVGNNVIDIDATSRREMTLSRYSRTLLRTLPKIYANKLRATNNADEILKASRNYVNEALKHPRKDNIQEFARGDVLLRIGKNDYRAEVIVGKRANGNLIMYDIIGFQPTNIKKISRMQDIVNTSKETDVSKEATDRDSASDINSIRENSEKSNTYEKKLEQDGF